MGLLSADELDTPLDFESLRKPGCLGLGTAAVTVIDDQTSIVDYLYNTSPLLRPRELRPVHPLPRGDGLDVQDDQADQGRRRPDRGPRHHAPAWPTTWASCPGTTICGLADGAAWPVKNALAKFRAEFEEYIRTHQDGAAPGDPAPGGDRPRRRGRPAEHRAADPARPGRHPAARTRRRTPEPT